MGEERLFRLKQIVWAKVPDYPWWPARIVKCLQQHNRNVYRVHFFGDPTYCYLKQSQLLAFQDGLAHSEEQCAPDFKLRKSIQLAGQTYRKQQEDKPCIQLLSDISHDVRPILADSFEETKFDSKLNIENTEKIEDQPKENHNSQTQRLLLQKFVSIHPANVINILEGPLFTQLKMLRGYVNRREGQLIQSRLKDSLLSKYKLENLSPTPLSDSLPKQNFLRRSLIKKSKKNSSMGLNRKSKELVQKKSVLKIYRILKQNSIDPSPLTYQEKAIQIIKKMKSKFCLESKDFKRQYKSFVQWLKVQSGITEQNQGSCECSHQFNEDSFFGATTVANSSISPNDICIHSNEPLDLEINQPQFDQEILIHAQGEARKQQDQSVGLYDRKRSQASQGI